MSAVPKWEASERDRLSGREFFHWSLVDQDEMRTATATASISRIPKAALHSNVKVTLPAPVKRETIKDILQSIFMPLTGEPLMTVKQAKAIWGCSTSYAYMLIRCERPLDMERYKALSEWLCEHKHDTRLIDRICSKGCHVIYNHDCRVDGCINDNVTDATIAIGIASDAHRKNDKRTIASMLSSLDEAYLNLREELRSKLVS